MSYSKMLEFSFFFLGWGCEDSYQTLLKSQFVQDKYSRSFLCQMAFSPLFVSIIPYTFLWARWFIKTLLEEGAHYRKLYPIWSYQCRMQGDSHLHQSGWCHVINPNKDDISFLSSCLMRRLALIRTWTKTKTCLCKHRCNNKPHVQSKPNTWNHLLK